MLFEEHTQKQELAETQHTWAELRDAIQMKRPFTIIVFNSIEDYNKCLKEELFDENYAKQTFSQTIEGKLKEFPSVFIFEPKGGLHDRVKNLYSKFNIRVILIGDEGKDYTVAYDKSGESSNLGNDLINGVSPDSVGRDQFYQIGAQYYKFIETT